MSDIPSSTSSPAATDTNKQSPTPNISTTTFSPSEIAHCSKERPGAWTDDDGDDGEGESSARAEKPWRGKVAEHKGKGPEVAEPRKGNSALGSAQDDTESEDHDWRGIDEALRRSREDRRSQDTPLSAAFVHVSLERRDAVHAQNQRRRWNTLQEIRCPCSTIAQLWGELEREPEIQEEGRMSRPARTGHVRGNASRRQGKRQVDSARVGKNGFDEPAEEEVEAALRVSELQTAIDESFADQRRRERLDAELEEVIRLSRGDSGAERARAKALKLEKDIASEARSAKSRPKVRFTDPVERNTKGENNHKRPAPKRSIWDRAAAGEERRPHHFRY